MALGNAKFTLHVGIDGKVTIQQEAQQIKKSFAGITEEGNKLGDMFRKMKGCFRPRR